MGGIGGRLSCQVVGGSGLDRQGGVRDLSAVREGNQLAGGGVGCQVSREDCWAVTGISKTKTIPGISISGPLAKLGGKVVSGSNLLSKGVMRCHGSIGVSNKGGWGITVASISIAKSVIGLGISISRPLAIAPKAMGGIGGRLSCQVVGGSGLDRQGGVRDLSAVREGNQLAGGGVGCQVSREDCWAVTGISKTKTIPGISISGPLAKLGGKVVSGSNLLSKGVMRCHGSIGVSNKGGWGITVASISIANSVI